MRFEKHNDNWQVCGYIFPNSEIKIGQRWRAVSGNIVTIEKNEDDDIYYSWMEKGEKKTHDKATFAFQCRYCLIVDNPLENVVCYSFENGEIKETFTNRNDCIRMNFQTIHKSLANGKDITTAVYIYVRQSKDGDLILEEYNKCNHMSFALLNYMVP